jgi:hypothetical protein
VCVWVWVGRCGGGMQRRMGVGSIVQGNGDDAKLDVIPPHTPPSLSSAYTPFS